MTADPTRTPERQIAPTRRGWQRFLVEFDAGRTIFREGDPGTSMYILREGEVEVLLEQNGDFRRLAVLEKGDFFGEMSLLEDLPRNASVRALTAVRAVRVDRATFDRMLRENPEIAVRIMRKLSRRLRKADRALRQETDELTPPSAASASPGLVRYRLRHEGTGRLFPIDRQELIVGRQDPVTGITPGVDLSSVDPERSSSRRHAKIFERDGALYAVEDIGTTNGTFVNGKRLRAGVPARIRAGDVVRFGLVDLSLID